jgi:hypothetical protein
VSAAASARLSSLVWISNHANSKCIAYSSQLVRPVSVFGGPDAAGRLAIVMVS